MCSTSQAQLHLYGRTGSRCLRSGFVHKYTSTACTAIRTIS